MNVQDLYDKLGKQIKKGRALYTVGKEALCDDDPNDVYFEEINHCEVADEADGTIVLIW